MRASVALSTVELGVGLAVVVAAGLSGPQAASTIPNSGRHRAPKTYRRRRTGIGRKLSSLFMILSSVVLVGEPEKVAKNKATESLALNQAFAEFAGEKMACTVYRNIESRLTWSRRDR